MGMLLGRYAESLFWFARYTERAASMARILSVQISHRSGGFDSNEWHSILALFADEERFAKVHVTPTIQNVAHFYIADKENPGSIMSAIAMARENGRLLRPLISVGMWSYINRFYSEMKKMTHHDLEEKRLAKTCARIAEQCDAVIGVTEGSYYRDAGWHFYQLGLWIERCDQTSRLLDVKLTQFAAESHDSKNTANPDFWHLLLRSFEAYHAFQRSEHGKMEPERVANFLMFNPSFPRSLAHCVGEMQANLHELYLGYHLWNADGCYELTDHLLYELTAASESPKLQQEFHGFSDQIQNRLAVLTKELGDTFFGHSDEISRIISPLALKQRSQRQARSDNQQRQIQTQSKPQKQSKKQPKKKKQAQKQKQTKKQAQKQTQNGDE